MKKRILSLVLILALLMSSLVLVMGCDDEGEKGNENESGVEGDSSGNVEATEAETLDDSKFNIFHNKAYLCGFIWPDNATEDEQDVGKQLRSMFNKLTGKQVVFVAESKATEDYDFLVVVGNTKLQESKDAYKELGEREASATVKGNKLIIAFDNLSAGLGIVEELKEELSKNKDPKETVRLSLKYKGTYKALPEIDALPTISGGSTPIDCGEGTYMTRVTNATAAKLAEYCASVEEAEFELISERTERNNVFYTLVGENEYIYAYYSNYNKEIRVITGPREALAEGDLSIKSKKTYEPYIASIPQPDNGMGYIIRMEDGRFLVFDGGYTGEDRVFKALKQLEPNENIVIAAWFISHPHSDHYPAFIDFIKTHGRDKTVTLERVIHNYVAPQMYNVPNSTAGKEDCSGDVEKLYAEAKLHIPTVPIIKAHTGQVIDFGATQVEVLYTIEDMVPTTMENTNASSMVVRVLMEGHSIMFLADTYNTSARILNGLWGDYLRSDIMQIAHHGQWPSIPELYEYIKGELVLVPAITNRYKNDVVDSRWKSVTDTVMKYAKDLSVSLDEMVIIELPYTYKNNKDEVLAKLASLR